MEDKREEKTVLCVFGERKRPVVFQGSCTNAAEDRKNLMKAIMASFSDVLVETSRSYFLQRESAEWGGLIDLSGLLEDRSTVHLCYTTSASVEAGKSSSEMQVATEKGKKACLKLGNPSEASAKVLKGLFPGYARGGKKRKFDPNSESVVAEQQRRKKSVSKTKGRSKLLTVLVVKEIPSCIPKGAARECLRKKGQVKDIPFQRYLSQDEVNGLIADTFSNLGDITIQYLQPHKSNTLNVVKQQELDGIGVIDLAKSGTLYLKYTLKVSSTDDEMEEFGMEANEYVSLDEENLNSDERRALLMQEATEVAKKLGTPISPGNSSAFPVLLSEEETIMSSDDDLDSSAVSKEQELQEWQDIRAEQDKAFLESLEIDREKETSKQKTEQWSQRVKQLQDTMKAKFGMSGNNEPSGINVAFKLPCGSKTQYIFQENSTMKNMYQFVLGSGVCPPFALCTQPDEYLPISTSNIKQYQGSLLHIVCQDRMEESTAMAALEVFSDPPLDDIGDYDYTYDLEDVDEGRIICEDDNERKLYMESVHAVVGVVHEIERKNIFEDVVDLYRGEIISEYPIFIEYKGEQGVDDGGLRRDMFTAFWEKAYSLLFEGATTLVPMIHPQIEMSYYPLLGRIISHGYLATGILPDRIALPTLIAIVSGPGVSISTKIMMDAFMDYISSTERRSLKQALGGIHAEKFPPKVMDEITTILGRFGCRKIPKPSTLISEIEHVAVYEFCTKPAAAITLIHSGIPLDHKEFWAKKSPADIQALHCRMCVTPSKVIASLEMMSSSNPSEERVYGYLTTMIGNMKAQELRLFLRFITGASVCVAPKIDISFNNLSGLGRRPVAHTCAFLLELPTSYLNYDDFYGDFKSILSCTENEFTWCMDAV